MSDAQSILCPKCHKANLRRARFCQHCGHDVVLNNSGPRYYITRVIKEGGQGAVFEAIDDNGHVYAIKQMLDRFTDPRERDEAISRFEAESKMLQQLAHPRIPRVYADFQDEGYHYLAMDFVRGEDLEDVIRRERSLPEQRVLTWAVQIADVLEYLHSRNPPIIFRDMKPSNIMIERDGNVKLIDFGIAKTFQPSQRGTQIGTPGYAPPEQYQGIATPESDVYSLGATLHHMLTGRDPRDEPPFSFPPVYGLKPMVSRRTSDTIQKALQMKPEDRWRSVAEFRRALIPAPAPAQVRVAPAAQPLPAAAQVAAPAAQPSPGVPAPARPAPAAAKAVPPASVAPTRKTQPIPAPAPQPAAPAKPPKPRRSGRFASTLLFLVLFVTLTLATVYLAFPDVAARYLPSLPALTTPTPQTLIQKPYTVSDLEVIVPPGGDVREAFVAAYTRALQEEFGPSARINPNLPLSYVGGEPQEIGEDAGGTKYRASLSGYVLVPQ